MDDELAEIARLVKALVVMVVAIMAASVVMNFLFVFYVRVIA